MRNSKQITLKVWEPKIGQLETSFKWQKKQAHLCFLIKAEETFLPIVLETKDSSWSSSKTEDT